MSVNIRAMIASKNEKKQHEKVELKDVNRELMIALLAIPVYKKEARDEEILSIIINAGASDLTKHLDKYRTRYAEMKKAKKVKKTKEGDYIDPDGFMVLVPKDAD